MKAKKKPLSAADIRRGVKMLKRSAIKIDDGLYWLPPKDRDTRSWALAAWKAAAFLESRWKKEEKK